MRTQITTCDMCGKEIENKNWRRNYTCKESGTNEDIYEFNASKNSPQGHYEQVFSTDLCTTCYLKVKRFIVKGGMQNDANS